MSLFYNEKTILYLKSSSLDLYNDKNVDGAHLEIPKDCVDNLEVANTEKLKALLGEFFAKFELGGKTGILVLSDLVVFQKVLPLAEVKKEEEKEPVKKDQPAETPVEDEKKTENFFESIPLDQKKLAKQELHLGDENILVATNKELYQTIVKQLDRIGFRVGAVVPAFLFKITPNKETLDIDDIKQIVRNQSLIKQANFLSEPSTETLIEAPVKSKTLLNKQFSEWLFAPVLVICLIVLLGIYWFKFGKSEDLSSLFGLRGNSAPLTTAISSTSPKPTIQPSASSSASPTTDKADLKIEVLNGTGTTGLAKKESDELSSLGYTSIDVGNASQTNNQTIITLDDKVSQDQKDEIVTLMKKDFDPVVVKSATSASDYDVIITTGPQSQ